MEPLSDFGALYTNGSSSPLVTYRLSPFPERKTVDEYVFKPILALSLAFRAQVIRSCE